MYALPLSRRRLRPLLALLACLLGASGLAGAGDEAPPSSWLPTVREGLARARETQKPLLVFVSPAPEGCPAAVHMAATRFADSVVPALAEFAVPVRLLSDRIEDEVSHAALARMGLTLQPALVVMDADGNVLHIQYAGLYPAFDEHGKVLPGAWGPLLSLDDVRAMVKDAVRERARLLAREQALRALPPDQASSLGVTVLQAHAQVLEALGRRDEALELLRGAAAEDRTEGEGVLLAGMLARAGHAAEAAAKYERLAAGRKDRGREAWLLEAADLRLHRQPAQPEGTAAEQVAAARTTLIALAETAVAEQVRLRARLSLAERLRLEGDEPGARAHLEALVASLGTGERAPPAWSAAMIFRLVGSEIGPGQAAVRAAQHYRMLIATHPHSYQAQQIKHAVFGMLRMMAEQPPMPQPQPPPR